MAELIVVEGSDERRLLLETDGPGQRGTSPTGVADWWRDNIYPGPATPGADPATVTDIASTVQEMVGAMVGSFDGLATDKSAGGRLSQAEIAFGIKVSAEGNAFVTKATAEANLTVTLSWDFI